MKLKEFINSELAGYKLNYFKFYGREIEITTSDILTLDERILLFAYTKDIGQKANTSLELGIKEYVMLEGFLNETLRKLPNFTSEFVYRRDDLGKDKLNNLKQLMEKGDVLRTNKFLSTSRSPKIVESIFRGNSMVTIKSKNGKDIEKYSYYNGIFNSINEQEVLFKTQSSFEILGITKSKSATYKHEIYLEQIT